MKRSTPNVQIFDLCRLGEAETVAVLANRPPLPCENATSPGASGGTGISIFPLSFFILHFLDVLPLGVEGSMQGPFRDRVQAGELLAEKLLGYVSEADVIVLGLPRGGVPVAGEVASRLGLPLDVFVVRKLGVPGHEELAMGAVATGGVKVMNERVLAEAGIAKPAIDDVLKREEKELDRREMAYRGGAAAVDVAGKTVILVDDGVATGSTILAGVEALRKRKAKKIIVAAPTIAAASMPALEAKADEVVAVVTPEPFVAVGKWYEDFSQTSDEEVRGILDFGV